MWWENGYHHMSCGIIVMPLLCIILVAIIIYLLCRKSRSDDEYCLKFKEERYKEDKYEMEKEIRDLKEKISELKKKKDLE